MTTGNSTIAGLRQVRRESLLLPAAFWTVTLLGGLRVDPASGNLRFLAPPLVLLVLAVALVTVLVRCGALAPARLLAPHRSGLENATGAALLLALFFASAQTLHAVTPDAGLWHLLGVFMIAALLANTLASAPLRIPTLRALTLTFAVMLLFKYVVLAGLAAPAPSVAPRVVMALLEGVTLGAGATEPVSSASGYAAFATCALYVFALLLLPGHTRRGTFAPPETAQVELERWAGDAIEGETVGDDLDSR
jgi:hypothetical protein